MHEYDNVSAYTRRKGAHARMCMHVDVFSHFSHPEQAGHSLQAKQLQQLIARHKEKRRRHGSRPLLMFTA